MKDRKSPTKAAPPPATKNKTPGRSSNRATTHAPDAAPPASPSKSKPPITRSDVTGSTKTKILPPKK